MLNGGEIEWFMNGSGLSLHFLHRAMIREQLTKEDERHASSSALPRSVVSVNVIHLSRFVRHLERHVTETRDHLVNRKFPFDPPFV